MTNEVTDIETAVAHKVDILPGYGPLISTQELAAILHVTDQAVRTMNKKGLLPPFVQPTRKMFWRKADIIDLINSSATQDGPTAA